MRTLKQLQPSCQAEAILEKVGKWQEIVNRQPSSTSEDNEKMTKRNYPYVFVLFLPFLIKESSVLFLNPI